MLWCNNNNKNIIILKKCQEKVHQTLLMAHVYSSIIISKYIQIQCFQVFWLFWMFWLFWSFGIVPLFSTLQVQD